MKKNISVLLITILLFTCIFPLTIEVRAAPKTDESREIAIVFDNSGSMYIVGNQAWCRATYAMEVFASMLNAGDVLQIYPMHPITVDGKKYTMDNPLRITDAAEASMIREIYTPSAEGTPMESIDCAIEGLQKLQAEKKYLIILTDGGMFSVNGIEIDVVQTAAELDKRIQQNAGEDMTVMYLGIGSSACMPNTEVSSCFFKKKVENSEEVLATLTEMCNRIFGRDRLPEKNKSGDQIDFDISMRKLLVFVQGENIADLSVSEEAGGKLANVQKTMYSTTGTGSYLSLSDTSLQGMIVTYTDCAAGTYTIDYTGNATSVEIYYEPDADLDFVFTDANGGAVNSDALIAGDYKVSFGMKDAKTGQLMASDLLGNPRYQGYYSINGQKIPIEHSGYNGEVPVTLNIDDVFDAQLTVTYLSGYSITKDSSDFGWPEGGIRLTPRTPGEMRLEISGGDDIYSLQDLEEGSPYIAKVYFQGTQLTGSELEKVELKWNPDTSNAEITKEFADDHYKLRLHYKDPAAPQNTACGSCTVPIYAVYSARGYSESQTESPLTYNIVDEFSLLQMDMFAPEDFIVIGDLADSQEIVVNLKLNGASMTERDFASTELLVDSEGINYSVTAREQDSTYLIKLLPTDKITEGDYRIKATVLYEDHIGRPSQADDWVPVTLSGVPLWMRWAIRLLALLILLVLIWIILHIKVLPKKAHTTRKLSSMIYDGEIVTQNANFAAEIKKGGAKVQSQYAGKKFGVSMDVTPGRESFLYKPQKRKSVEVRANSVKKFGPAKIQEAMIGSAKYVLDETGAKLVPAIPTTKPFTLTNGSMVKYSGIINDAGVDKDFEVTVKYDFK